MMRRLGFPHLSAVIAALSLAFAAAAPAADPFYLERLEAGIQAAEREDHEDSVLELEIACFGLLEEPPLLAQGLVRLALSQAALGDRRGFRDTFDRLVEADTRFGAYAAAALDADLRTSFEQLLVRWVPPATLQALPAFSRLAASADEPVPAASPRERRRELRRRVESEGDRPELLTELARLELDQGRPARALDWLDRLPAAGEPAAACLRERAAEGTGACPARPARGACPAPTATAGEFHLGCLVREDRWTEAAALLAELPPTSRQRVAKLERRIQSKAGADVEAPAPAAGAPTTGESPPELSPSDPAATTPPTTTPPAATPPTTTPPPAGPPSDPPAAGGATASPAGGEPSASDRVELEALATRLATANSLDETRAALAGAAALANRHPQWAAAQLVAAEAAYFSSDWPRTLAYLRRAGDPTGREPRFAFYYAVALYETGDRRLAAEILRPLVPRLERSAFVDSYVARILGGG